LTLSQEQEKGAKILSLMAQKQEEKAELVDAALAPLVPRLQPPPNQLLFPSLFLLKALSAPVERLEMVA
jgi:hypothetical protein